MMDDELHDLFGDARRSKTAQHETDEAEEAAAKAAIGRVLAGMPDAARARVVRWVIARFGTDLNAESEAEPASPVESAASTARRDPTLAVDDLSDLFSPPEDLDEFSDVRLKPDTTDPGKPQK